jgi:hypothetical protein
MSSRDAPHSEPDLQWGKTNPSPFSCFLSFFAEFDVPSNSLLQGGKEGWLKMIGPDASKSQQFLLNKQGGQHLPEVKNILIIDRK